MLNHWTYQVTVKNNEVIKTGLHYMEEKNVLFVVSCSSWKKACAAFNTFAYFMGNFEAKSIEYINYCEKLIVLNDDTSFIFCDYRFVDVFETKYDVIEMTEFMEEILDWAEDLYGPIVYDTMYEMLYGT